MYFSVTLKAVKNDCRFSLIKTPHLKIRWIPLVAGRHSFTVHFFLKLFNQIVNYNYVIYWGYGRFFVFFKSKALIYRKSKPLVSPFALSIHVKLKENSFKIRFSVKLLWLITVAIFLIASSASWAVNSMDWDTYNSFYCSVRFLIECHLRDQKFFTAILSCDVWNPSQLSQTNN